MNETNQLPEWFDGKKVEEAAFCRAFLAEHPMICVSKSFFTKEGRVCDESRLRREIYDAVNPYVTTGLAKKVDSLLELLRVEAYAEDLPVQTDRIHMANGTLFLDGTFTEDKEYCRNRLPVAYVPEAAFPEGWLEFLNELLCRADSRTVQEYVG